MKNNNIIKIGVDVDEVLSETVTDFIDFYNNKYNKNFCFDDVIEYSFCKSFGFNPDDEKQIVMEFFASDYFPKLSPVDGSQQAINMLAKTAKLFAITSRPEQLAKPTEEWLERYYPNCFSGVILTNSHFDKSKTKSSECMRHKIDIFIEDQIVFAEDCAKVCSSVYLLNKPWNKLPLNNDRILRASSWSEIIASINRTIKKLN